VGRRLFNTASTVSLVLCLLVGLPWVWSYFRYEEVTHKYAGGYWSLGIDWGRVCFISMARTAGDELLPAPVPPGNTWHHFSSAYVVAVKKNMDRNFDLIGGGWAWRHLGVWIGRAAVLRRPTIVASGPMWPILFNSRHRAGDLAVAAGPAEAEVKGGAVSRLRLRPARHARPLPRMRRRAARPVRRFRRPAAGPACAAGRRAPRDGVRRTLRAPALTAPQAVRSS